MKIVFRKKGGEGSGHYGHSGIPDHHGGSLPGDGTSVIITRLQRDDPYIPELTDYFQKILDKYKKEGRGLQAPDISYYYSARLWKGTSDRFFLDFALAKYIEERTDRETMVAVLESQQDWTMSPLACQYEWNAAQKLTGVALPKGVPPLEISDIMLEGYKARTEFTQQVFRELYGESMELYRGVKGRYATAIRNEYINTTDSMISRKVPMRELQKYMDHPKMDIKVYGLSSWTDSYTTAQYFAGKGLSRLSRVKGVIMEKKISYKDVWMLPRDMGIENVLRFVEDNNEVVTLNDNAPMRVELRIS